MYVKNEPDCDFDITMEMMTDMETNLLREELFGNHCIASGKCPERSIFLPHAALFTAECPPDSPYAPFLQVPP
ncbi:hypothetical protein E2C01_056023 [Portunus trituberculatus]|uniref:Uncharacterized protein n=1 Tax=Portunus trituberculatus TaxID=210409 RepID=A0A5B7GW92_PORTR|nr:hypothetical protein [Portunus trituberculatus]